MMGPALIWHSRMDQVMLRAATGESYEKWEVPPPLVWSLTSAQAPTHGPAWTALITTTAIISTGLSGDLQAACDPGH